jgi:hypothetical protein
MAAEVSIGALTYGPDVATRSAHLGSKSAPKFASFMIDHLREADSSVLNAASMSALAICCQPAGP